MRGYREVLGFWNDFLAWLKGIGLRGVDLGVSDQHGGLVKAVETQFQEVTWQRCQTHFTRNILDACPKQLQSQLRSQLRVIWEAVEYAKRLLGALLMEKDKAWSTGRQYFDMRTYVEWKQEQTAMITNELQQTAAAGC